MAPVRFISIMIAALAVGAAVSGCAARTEPVVAPSTGDQPAQAPAGDPTGGPAAGMKLAPGLYDQPDGTVQAIGTLEYRDIEGGTWVILDGTLAEGDVGSVAAVIANADELKAQLEPLKGLAVIANGTRVKGASVRMAGPEISVTSISGATDTPGPAE